MPKGNENTASGELRSHAAHNPRTDSGVERRSVLREVRAEGDGDAAVVSGYAAIWDEVADIDGLWKEVVRRGAFRQSIADGDDVVALFNHNVSLLLGRTRSKTLSLVEDDVGLRFEVQVASTTAGRDLVASIKRGDIRGASFSFIPRKPSGQKWSVDADGLEMRELLALKLLDVSPATQPYYSGTEVALRSRDEWRTAFDAVAAAQRERALQLAAAD